MRRYLEVFFRHPIRFSLPVVVALAAGLAYGTKLPLSYTATATVFCDSPLPSASTFQQPPQQGFATPCGEKATSLQEFLHTQSFANRVAARATHRQQISDLAADEVVKPIVVTVSGPQIMTISVKSPSPTLAASTAQALIDEFVDELNAVFQQRNQGLARDAKSALDATAATLATAQTALDTYIQAHPNANDSAQAQLSSAVTHAQTEHDAAQVKYNEALAGGGTTAVDPVAFHIVDRPKVPTVPASIKKPLLLAVVGALMGGAVIVILVLVLLVAMDHSVRDELDVEPTVEVVGTVPLFRKGVLSPRRRRGGRETPAGFNVPSELVDCSRSAIRHLKLSGREGTTIAAAGPGATDSQRGTGTIAVTSCLRGEGRSTIAAGVAAALNRNGLRVTLAEFDLEHPSFSERYGIPSAPGVAEMLRDGKSIADCVYRPEETSVGILVAGDSTEGAADLLTQLLGSKLVDDLTVDCDVLVADLPRVSSDGNTVLLADLFSSLLFVVRTGAASTNEIKHAVEEFDKPPAAILNGVGSSIPRPLRALLER